MNKKARVIWGSIFIAILAFVTLFLIIDKRVLCTEISLDNKISLLSTSFGFPISGHQKPNGALLSAGYNKGLPGYNIPPLQEVDSGMGIANPGNLRKGDNATALPSTLLVASTFSGQLAMTAGKILGSEAKDKGFNIVLAGGVNLIREPRNGRNFEYASEDPLLSGIIAGSFVKGIQTKHVVSTLKHFAFNSQETGRVVLNAIISEKNARESDLLAFEIANEIGAPGAVMTAYNKVNGDYSSENYFLINTVLKGDWKYAGWVMSDWGGTHSTVKAVLAGLDQQSGYQYDSQHYFGKPLADAVRAGAISEHRIDDMFARIIKTLNKHNVALKIPSMTETDYAKNRIISQGIAEKGIVLLKNNNALPLNKNIRKLLVVGGNANLGVLSGAGASQVIPPESSMIRTKDGVEVYHPNSIISGLTSVLPNTEVVFDDGSSIERLKNEITSNDMPIIVVANQWSRETKDHVSLGLPNNQDQLIDRVSAMSNNVIVLLQTGGAVKMPWKNNVKAIIEAWYTGINGGNAIANILVGISNPSGKLPISFPLDESELPHPVMREWSTTTSSPSLPRKGFFDINYNIEGANVGYKWFLKKGLQVLYPFGYGLSYTNFIYSDFKVENLQKRNYVLSAKIKNSGLVAGTDTPQIYLYSSDGSARLISWAQVSLSPGQEKNISFELDPRLLSEYDIHNRHWQTVGGKYSICLSKFAGDCTIKKEVHLINDVAFKYN
ncbi:glycoside hydrolase family 3 C-terminal domain-containing protein [Scandinavium sp. NPDC088450]|uniref:beta-glucosidase n=1 Tax=Scandinavium sp. NPDC088450 TaxID=3364514 RepID=UPI00384B5792